MFVKRLTFVERIRTSKYDHDLKQYIDEHLSLNCKISLQQFCQSQSYRPILKIHIKRHIDIFCKLRCYRSIYDFNNINSEHFSCSPKILMFASSYWMILFALLLVSCFSGHLIHIYTLTLIHLHVHASYIHIIHVYGALDLSSTLQLINVWLWLILFLHIGAYIIIRLLFIWVFVLFFVF